MSLLAGKLTKRLNRTLGNPSDRPDPTAADPFAASLGLDDHQQLKSRMARWLKETPCYGASSSTFSSLAETTRGTHVDTPYGPVELS